MNENKNWIVIISNIIYIAIQLKQKQKKESIKPLNINHILSRSYLFLWIMFLQNIGNHGSPSCLITCSPMQGSTPYYYSQFKFCHAFKQAHPVVYSVLSPVSLVFNMCCEGQILQAPFPYYCGPGILTALQMCLFYSNFS